MAEKRKRSKSYPGHSLQDCIALVTTVSERLGSGPYNRESIAEALECSPNSGSLHRRIGAAGHFDLFDRTGDGYRISPLAERILTPISEDEQLAAIGESFYRPALYAELMEQFAPEGRVPQMLENTLVRRFGIEQTVAKNAATVFRTSGEYAGVIDGQGRIESAAREEKRQAYSGDEVPVGSEHGGEPARAAGGGMLSGNSDVRSHQSCTQSEECLQSFRLALADGRFATLTAPSVLSVDDVELIQKQIEVLAFQAQLAGRRAESVGS